MDTTALQSRAMLGVDVLSEADRLSVAPTVGSARITRDDLLDAREVAELVRVDRRTILRWALEGSLPSIKRGRRVLFLRTQVEQWLLAGSRGHTH